MRVNEKFHANGLWGRLCACYTYVIRSFEVLIGSPHLPLGERLSPGIIPEGALGHPGQAVIAAGCPGVREASGLCECVCVLWGSLFLCDPLVIITGIWKLQFIKCYPRAE